MTFTASLSAVDQGRAQRLRRMKGIALSLLLIAAIVYLSTLRVADQGVWGFVNAGAEAAMAVNNNRMRKRHTRLAERLQGL